VDNVAVLKLISGSDVSQKLCERGAVVGRPSGFVVCSDLGRDIADLGVTHPGRKTLPGS